MNDIAETQSGMQGSAEEAEFLPSGGRIVVGVDSSPASKAALRAAARIAALTGATVEALGVWELPIAYGYSEAHARGMGAETGWSPEDDARKMLNAAVDEVFGPDRPVGLRTVLLSGKPSKRILEHAEGASLIVVGSRGHAPFVGLMLGSVSTKCAAAASCPVLIVHAPADESMARQ